MFEPRRWLALGFTEVQTVIALGLAWFLTTRQLAWPILAVFMVAEEAAMAVVGLAPGAWTVTLVEPDQLAAWNGWNQTAWQVVSLVGPSLGGILLAAQGAPDAVAWSAVGLALGGLGIVAAGSSVHQEKSRHSPMQGAWRDGWRFIRAQPGMLPMMLFFAVTNGLNNVEAVLVPILARLVLHVPAWQFGLLPAAFGTGALLGSWAGVCLDRYRRRTRWMLAAMALFGLAIVGMGMAPSIWWFGEAYVTAGVGFATAEVRSSTLWQRLIPDALRGRVLSALSTMARTANPLGFILAGVLVSVLGIRRGLLAGGGAILVAA
jgi:MFS family permease